MTLKMQKHATLALWLRGRKSVPIRLFVLILCVVSLPLAAQTNFIPAGATWKYLDDGSDPGALWQRLDYDDNDWNSGPAPLGYGNGNEATLVDAAGFRPTTIYYRHHFVVPDRRLYSNLTLRLLRDDGAIVYLNGTEIFRDNMPAGAVNHSTPATRAVDGLEETRFIQHGSYYGYLADGENVLAVEVHQAPGGTADASFDLQLVGNIPLTPPEIEIIDPTDGDVYSLGLLQIEIQATDADGHLYRVDYFANTNKIGESLTPPFSFVWPAFTPGRFTLQALAIDNSGRRGFSPPVHVQMGAVFEDRITRGPYLQMATPTSLVIRWRTDWFTDSLVRVGDNPADLDTVFHDPKLTVEHEVHLNGLEPDTRYFYELGKGDLVLASGPDYYFITPPAAPKPTRIWVIGDSGTANANARAVRDAYAELSEDLYTDLWLMLGDNAYEEGTDAQYQSAVFDMYPRLLRQTVLWPTIGNHDAAYAHPSRPIPYLDIFTLPTQGEAGGLASGTENYYAFDYSNIHFVCLDSALSDRATSGPMLTWLEQDLAATAQDWIIAFWHHPPYSKGTHDSDRELDMIDMRRNALPILERYGVDLVLCGHSHVYERSFLLNGHYGFSTNLGSAMILDASSGDPALGEAYRKPAGGLGANKGAVYAVCGCSGEGGGFRAPNHPAMRFSTNGFGSMILTVEGLEMKGLFLNQTGAVLDEFALLKGSPGSNDRPALTIHRESHPQRIEVAWPTSYPSFHLEQSDRPDHSGNWQSSTKEVRTEGRQQIVTLPMDTDVKWLRLRADP